MISLSTASLYHLPLGSVFALTAEAGFDGVELVTGPEVWLRGAERVARLAERRGQAVFTVHQTLLPWSPRGAGSARMLDAAETALALGARHVVVHAPATAGWTSPVGQRWMEALKSTRALLRGSTTRIALENWGIGPEVRRELVVRRAPVLREFALQHDLDLTFDTCHAGIERLDIIRAFDYLQPRVANVHLSNLSNRAPALDVLLARPLLSEHRMPEDGILPLGEFVSHLVDIGYRHPITYEISPISLRAWSPSELRRRLRECVAFVRAVYEREAPAQR